MNEDLITTAPEQLEPEEEQGPGRLQRLLVWLHDPKTQRHVAIVAVGFGATMLKKVLEETEERLNEIESRLPPVVDPQAEVETPESAAAAEEAQEPTQLPHGPLRSVGRHESAEESGG